MKEARPTDAPQQLSMLAMRDDLPVRFRLDERTRRRGLAHIAQIRAQLAARQPVTASRVDRSQRAA